jgi:dTDP-4-dehydrorhamnose reductase
MTQGGKVVIIGAGGRLGAALVTKYAPTHEVVPVRRADLDLAQSETILPFLQGLSPAVVVYTAGTTNVDLCEDHPEESLKTNAEAPAILAQYCRDHGARLIHISTDYVFDGENPIPVTETDATHPINVYGRHKLAGEQAVLAASPDFLVVRVSWLFGKDRPSFPDMILKRALENDEVFAIADKVSCPTFSDDLADWIEPMLTDTRYAGVLHLCNSGSCTWQEYGQKTLDIAVSLGLKLRATTVQGQSRINFPPFKAQRPEFTAFDISKYITLSGRTPRSWQEALEAYLREKYLPA